MSDATATPRSFQEIILRLQSYWAGRGCAVLQPYDMEVGAGTFHPATTLRSLGTRPWAAAYVQPSRRPTDGRYGENPNRLQHYYQYQVILKPSPPDIQELYLGSLEAIGIEQGILRFRLLSSRERSAGPRYVLALLGLDDVERRGFRLVRTEVRLESSEPASPNEVPVPADASSPTLPG